MGVGGRTEGFGWERKVIRLGRLELLGINGDRV